MTRTLRTRVLGASLALGAVLAAGCNNKDEEFAGTYVGDGVDSQSSSNRKTFTLNVDAAGTTVAGTFRIKAILIDSSGIVNGTLNGSALELTLTSSTGDCPYKISGTWQGDRITGSYLATPCFVRSDGTIDLKKE
jgi:hypothetical protein